MKKNPTTADLILTYNSDSNRSTYPRLVIFVRAGGWAIVYGVRRWLYVNR